MKRWQSLALLLLLVSAACLPGARCGGRSAGLAPRHACDAWRTGHDAADPPRGCRGEDDGEELEEDEDDDLDEAERAFLLVRRVVSEDRPLEGKPVTVTIEVYNAGAM